MSGELPVKFMREKISGPVTSPGAARRVPPPQADDARLFLLVPVLIVMLATLRPAEPVYGLAKTFCQWSQWNTLDNVMNVLLFAPLGMALIFQGVKPWLALVLCAGLSFSVEVLQFWIPGRDSDLSDVIQNTLGGAAGICYAHSKSGLSVRPAMSRLTRAMARPKSRIANRFAVAASLVAVTAIWLTGYLSLSSFPPSRYRVGSRLLEASTRPLRIGGDAIYGEHFFGMIDEVRIYNRALTPLEIGNDMNDPVSTTPPAKGLVAAYGFDEGRGEVVNDASGHGHRGGIERAGWVELGKFHHALAFNGRNSMVSIPAAADLNLADGMTLSAWVYPFSKQRGWRQIIKREADAYYLMCSSDAGSLRPAGGGSFAGTPCSLRSSGRVEPGQWVYLALTYNGSAFSLYQNGKLLDQMAFWQGDDVMAASVGRLNLLTQGRSSCPGLGSSLAQGTPLNLTVAISHAPFASRPLPLLKLSDGAGKNVLTLSANGTELSLKVRTRAMNLGLYSAPVIFRRALAGALPGKTVSVEVWQAQGRWQAKVDQETFSAPACTIGDGWRFFCASEFVPERVGKALDHLWLAALMCPIGFWTRRQVAVPVAAMLLISFTTLPQFSGLGPMSGADFFTVLLGLLTGLAFRRKTEPLPAEGKILLCR
jgi:VanZ family protein